MQDENWYTPSNIKEIYNYSDFDSVYRAVRRSEATVIGDKPAKWKINKEQFDYWHLHKQFNQTNNNFVFPNFPVEEWTDYWTLEGDWLITADWHSPYFNSTIANYIPRICEKYEIENHLIAGDLLDEEAYSHFVDYKKLSWKEEKGYIREIQNGLFKPFKRTCLLMGNHDNRMFKALAGRGDPFSVWEEVFLKEATPDWVSIYAYCYLKSGDRKWYISHPTKGGITDTWLRRRKEIHWDCNILGAHTHKYFNRSDASAEFQLIGLPGMQDQKRIGWKMRRDDDDYNWVTGFAIIKNGFIRVFTEKFTDWELELK
ncbi:hypothetical protein M0R19_04645 [Candidatus Pacearchaeota archaeon]|nr:hypothetical protein [Candidatus Pacearchaeota archaeon]